MSPKTDRKIHFIALWIWLALVIPTLLWWSESIKWLVFMSIYACIMGHYSSWQAAKAEHRIERGE